MNITQAQAAAASLPGAERPAARKRPAESGRMKGSLATILFYLVIAAVLYDGWLNRGDHLFTAETGVGYALGIVGGSMMLAMLLYSARKKARFMRRLGPVRYWFRAHMLLGVLGPTLIVYHSNFQLGSLNSTVALFSMLAVALSGLVGRYIYTRIHFGLYGSKATLRELRERAQSVKEKLSTDGTFDAPMLARLEEFEKTVLTPFSGVASAAWRLFVLGVQTRSARRVLLRRVRASLREELRQGRIDAAMRRRHQRLAVTYLKVYLATVRKVAGLGFYERLFSFWHIVHVPLFVMLVISGIVHVVAVHLY